MPLLDHKLALEAFEFLGISVEDVAELGETTQWAFPYSVINQFARACVPDVIVRESILAGADTESALTSEQSKNAWRAALLIVAARECFVDHRKAMVKLVQIDTDGRHRLSHCDTEQGTHAVLTHLLRIEYGISA